MKAAVIREPSEIGVETVDTPTIRDNEILERGGYYEESA
jgi:hypothetical protein